MEVTLLIDNAIKGLKPRDALYRVEDRGGMYVTATRKGTVTFRLDSRLNGRRETLTIGRCGPGDGISLLVARQRCMETKRAIAQGVSPSQKKQREKRRLTRAKTFGEHAKVRFEA